MVAAQRRRRVILSPYSVPSTEIPALPSDGESLRQLAEAMPQLVWVAGEDGAIEWVNRRWSDYTGDALEAVRGHESWAAVHPDDVDRTRALWVRALDACAPFEAEFRLRAAASGAYRWFLTRAQPLRMGAADGSLVGTRWFGTCTDIHAERSARERAERLARIGEGLAHALTPDGVAAAVVEQVIAGLGAHAGGLLVRTPDGDALSMVRASGYATASLRPWTRLPLDATLPLTDAVRTGEIVVVESAAAWRARYPERGPMRGVARSGSWAAVPLVTDGRVIGALALSFIHEHAVGPDELPFLASAASQCAVALERARLYEAERGARVRAEEADRVKRDFLAVMSHELRTPLNAIGGQAQLLDDGIHGPVTAPQREALRRIARAQSQLLGVIDDVLRYAKLDARATQYALGVTDIGPAIADAVDIVAPQARSKDITIACDVPHDACFVWADASKLGHVLRHLVGNAVKFTDAHGRVTIEVAVETASSDRLAVRVRDTGIGIPRERLEAVFDPFAQVDSSRARRYEGIGLGLTISRELARGMGGDVTVASAPGEGTTFTLTLRRALDVRKAPTDRRRPAERRSGDRRRTDDRRSQLP